ncbi:hypothetical protein [Caulobacter sp. FWC2]|uniref:hypothetical protein n=1 Tax=Caulobacter sp. FWC2 TaxID=69664 RepID=UPI000C149462|nr:hypothetical protein [Caulobacter sp. FWC2]PIB91291.1 hypothetical protein CSW62_06700 [Caulobacter sp. FWC2]
MIERTSSADFLNDVANHPDVRSALGGHGIIDLSELLRDESNIALVAPEGGFVYVHLGGHVYEVHSMFLPGAKTAVAAARASLAYMFTQTECLEVVTRVPAPNLSALGLVRACGFDKLFTRRGGWTDGTDFTVYGLTLDRWVQRSDVCRREGEAFHELIEAALGHENHPEDEAHDRAAGATALMFKAGKALKAAWTYNKWALIAGYGLITPIGADQMDIGNAVIGLRGDVLEVVKCQ